MFRSLGTTINVRDLHEFNDALLQSAKNLTFGNDDSSGIQENENLDDEFDRDIQTHEFNNQDVEFTNQ